VGRSARQRKRGPLLTSLAQSERCSDFQACNPPSLRFYSGGDTLLTHPNRRTSLRIAWSEESQRYTSTRRKQPPRNLTATGQNRGKFAVRITWEAVEDVYRRFSAATRRRNGSVRGRADLPVHAHPSAKVPTTLKPAKVALTASPRQQRRSPATQARPTAPDRQRQDRTKARARETDTERLHQGGIPATSDLNKQARQSLPANMSNQAVGEVYKKIIEDVLEASKQDFEEAGVDEAVIAELRTVCSTGVWLPLPPLLVPDTFFSYPTCPPQPGRAAPRVDGFDAMAVVGRDGRTGEGKVWRAAASPRPERGVTALLRQVGEPGPFASFNLHPCCLTALNHPSAAL